MSIRLVFTGVFRRWGRDKYRWSELVSFEKTFENRGYKAFGFVNHFATMALCSGPHCECVGSDSPLQRAKPILGNFGINLGFLSNST